MKQITRQAMIITAGLVLIVSAWQGTAAAKIESDAFFPDFRNDSDMAGGVKNRNILNSGVQYGIWLTSAFIDDRDGKKRISSSVSTARPWLELPLWTESYLYVRGKYTLNALLYEDGYKLDTYKHIYDVDIAMLRMATPSHNLEISLGRKYFLLGSGLLFNGRADGLEIDFYSRFIGFQLFGAYTGLLQKDSNPYGLSDKDLAVGARRVFAGGQIFTDFYNQTLYVIGLFQYDYGKENYYASSRYYCFYIGGGLKGELFRHLEYNGEFVHERGRSFTLQYGDFNNINASAAIFNLNYYVNVMLKPVLTAQYAWGSGDSDRENYKQSNGNIRGADNGFIYFGTFMGGYALKPLLANIHVIRFGASFMPFSWTDVYYVKNISISAKYAYYMKHKNYSPINYGYDATKHQREIGHGLDLSLRWLITSDVSVYTNYGLFIPGDAYGTRFKYGTSVTAETSSTKYKHFVMAGVNMSI